MNEIKEIRWSREASIMRGSYLFSAFQSHSYIARVEFEDGFVTMVCCPAGAAELPEKDWESYVRESAKHSHKTHEALFS